MKIAYILADPGIGLFGTKGASVHAQEMIRAFRQLGHDVTVYCTKRGSTAGDPSTESVPQDLRNLPVFVVPVAAAKGSPAREQAVARTAARMAALAREEPYDLIYERYSLFSDAGAVLARAASTPLVLEVNAPLLSEQAAHRTLHDAEGAREATLRSIAAADVVSCVTQPVAEWVHQLIDPQGPAAAPKVIVSPNGVNTERFTPHPPGTAGAQDSDAAGRAPGCDAAFTVGFLGTLKPWHGTDLLLKALAAVPPAKRRDWRCEILGDGPQLQPLKELTAALGLDDQVSFRGPLAPDQVPEALARWDAAVAPYPDPGPDQSHYFSPMKVYEYLAAGLPTVASAVGELPQLITDGVTGVLVPGSDVEALASALTRLAGDPDHRRQLGAAARAEAVARHSWRSRASAVVEAVRLPQPIPAREVLA